jgi:DnaK suppressor protein
MGPERLAYFRDKLLRWRDELCQNLPGHPESISAQSLPDWVDSASCTTQLELSWADRERTVVLIRQIDAALFRIAAGTYGYCTESGEEIGIERLMALPTAQYCLEIQSDIEWRQKKFR